MSTPAVLCSYVASLAGCVAHRHMRSHRHTLKQALSPLPSPVLASPILLLTHGLCSRTRHELPRHDLRRHQALALAADTKQWPAAALAKKFKADAGSLESAIEYCSSYVVVHSSDGAAYAQRRAPPGASPAAQVGSEAELQLGTSDPLSLASARSMNRTQKPVTFKAEI